MTDFDLLLKRVKDIVYAAVTTSTEKIDRLQQLIRETEQEMKEANSEARADVPKCP